MIRWSTHRDEVEVHVGQAAETEVHGSSPGGVADLGHTQLPLSVHRQEGGQGSQLRHRLADGLPFQLLQQNRSRAGMSKSEGKVKGSGTRSLYTGTGQKVDVWISRHHGFR